MISSKIEACPRISHQVLKTKKKESKRKKKSEGFTVFPFQLDFFKAEWHHSKADE